MIRWRQVRSGQTLVLAALSMVVMVGFVALAVDVGLLLTIKRRMQTAADAGAIAAATALRTGGDFGQITQAADGIASLNGFSAVDVTVYSPPEHGDPAYVGNAGYVEVDVAKAEPTYFLRALGYRSIDVSAKAISGAEPAPVCVYALDRLVAGAMKVTGNGTSVKVACGVMDDSDSADALDSSEGAGLSAASIGVSGSYNPGTFVPTPITGVAPIADPLASLPAPPATACNRETVTDSGGYPASGSQPANGSSFEVPAKVYRKGISLDGSFRAVTFQQGTYGNGITISGDIGTTTFNPGQYQSAAGQDSIDISGSTNAIFTPGDYTFCGSVSFTGNDTLTLSPGTYEGGIRIGGNVRSVTFSPGTYIINGGGFSVTGGATLSGSGVTFFLNGAAYAPVVLSGDARVNLSAPVAGPLKGILFFQDRSVAPGDSADDSVIIGEPGSTFDGALYFPTTGLTYAGDSSASGYTFLIADRITITGNSVLGNDYSSLEDGAPIKSTTLYE